MAIRYVDFISGSDLNDGLSVANAVKTLQAAFDLSAGGDEIRAMNNGTHADADGIVTGITLGASATNPVVIVGADSSGDPLNGSGVAIVSGSALASGNLLTINDNSNFFIFRDMVFRDAPSTGVFGNALGGQCGFARCRFTANGSHGAAPKSTAWAFYDCESDNNADSGFTNSTSNRGTFFLQRCRVHNNGKHGAFFGARSVDTFPIGASDCEIYENTLDGLRFDHFTSQPIVATGNTVYSNGGTGINFDGSTSPSIGMVACFNNTMVSNGGYGLGWDAMAEASNVQVSNNHTHNNTSGATDRAGGMPGINNVTGDPLFANAASADFAPQASSPLKEAGLFGVDIGARRAADASGGGGSPVTRGWAI